MISLARTVRISRPRFWMYLAGPYLLGATAAGARWTVSTVAVAILMALYFTLPANLLVYGVNDIFDYDTDRLNPKKTGYESLVEPQERRALVAAIAAWWLPFAMILPFVKVSALPWLVGFVALSICYSAPPIRTKGRPIFDSVSNLLYAMPGFFGYELAGGGIPAAHVVAAALCWTMAMHAYSAVPDIAADRQVGLATTATLLGQRGTIAACLALYSVAAALMVSSLGWVAVVLGAAYLGLMVWSLGKRTGTEILPIYRWFPLVNTVAGFAIFVTLYLKHR